MSIPTKSGRPRRYGLPSLPGFANAELGARAAWLRELAERVYDQIVDLPPEALDFSPPDTKLSIGRLTAHLAWAEATWVSRLTGEPIPQDLQGELDIGALTAFDRPPAPAGTAAGLIAFCRRVQESFTGPALSRVADILRPAAGRRPDGERARGGHPAGVALDLPLRADRPLAPAVGLGLYLDQRGHPGLKGREDPAAYSLSLTLPRAR